MTEITTNRYVCKNGYVQLSKQINLNRIKVLEHVFVWELKNGKKPKGFDVHHINGVRNDNRIENLQLIDHSSHQRYHHGWKLIENIWYKPCTYCNSLLEVNTDNFNRSGRSLKPMCKKCIKMYIKKGGKYNVTK